MPKRIAPTAAFAQRKAPKKGSATPVDALLAECGDNSIDSCRAVLKIVGPLAVGLGGERHRFQASVVTFIDDVAKTELDRRTHAIEIAKASIGDLEQEQSDADEAAGRLQASIKEKLLEKEVRQADFDAANEKWKAASEALQAAQGQVYEMQATRGPASERQGELQTMMAQLWEPLKAGAIPAKSSGRARAIKNLMASIGSFSEFFAVNVSATLAAGLPVALKSPPGDRGEFANIVIESGEEVLQNLAAGASAKLTEIDAQSSELNKAVTIAAEVEKAHKEDALQEQQALFDADNAWVEEDEKLVHLKQANSKLASRMAAAGQEFAQAQSRLSAFHGVLTAWQTACEPPAQEPAPPSAAVEQNVAASTSEQPAEPTEEAPAPSVAGVGQDAAPMLVEPAGPAEEAVATEATATEALVAPAEVPQTCMPEA